MFLLIGFFYTPISANETNNDNKYYLIVNGRKWSRYVKNVKDITNMFDSVRNVIWADNNKEEKFREIVIPEGIKELDDLYFINCTYLEKVTLPKGLKKIRRGAFRNCTSLKTINIPNGVTEIGTGAFRNCKSLEYITIPDSVKEIEGAAFENCTNLKSIILSNNITKINPYLFYNCISLEKVNIPNGVTAIYRAAFHNCTSLKTINIPNGVTFIGMSAFAYCRFKKITIPNSVKEIRIDWGGTIVIGLGNLFMAQILYITTAPQKAHLGEQDNILDISK